MSLSLIPELLVEKLTDLTPQMLLARDIHFLMLDFDNTIVPYTADLPAPEMEQWLLEMKQSPVGLCVVSNSKRNRVKDFCAAREIPCITHARKPFSKGIFQCRDLFGLDLCHTALAGDQIYTDVLGANCAGTMSILVRPIHLHNIWLRLRHWLELPLIAMAKRRIK